MHILINDQIQNSDAPIAAKSPALAELCYENPLTVTFDSTVSVSHFGIGNTDATEVQLEIHHIVGIAPAVTNVTVALGTRNKNGLYEISAAPLNVQYIIITHNGNYFGRIGAGIGLQIGTGRAKEPGIQSTNESRITLSGQVIPGSGGYSYRSVGLDSRYKLGQSFFDEVDAAYQNQIGRGFPFFILFDCETSRLPFDRLYANDKNQTKWAFEGSIRQMLYSFKFNFIERF